ncbi:hypothetical protein N9O17_00120 [Candidatus Pelagibacter sp.]|jgi:uncharacterized protein YcfL|nr:hypothetical protein [Candidatus Pelagibacter sp.]|tara:strand:- start:408 stop:584 length:177 start_codon:yes stop_codon:yes gene_type:complete
MLRIIILIFFLLTGCSYDQTKKVNNVSQIEFSDDLTIEEFKIKLEEHTKNSSYPSIDN